MFSFFTYSQNIIGTWSFDYILPDTIKKGDNLKPISNGDLMKINDDGTFNYEISKAKLIAHGTWQLKGNKLFLNYMLPQNNIRIYQIYSEKNSLILNLTL